jgi:dipeptidase E
MRQIFAMGGGGFSMEPETLVLDRYILGLSKPEKPKVCFIPTASGDSDKYIVRFYSTYTHLSCQPSHLSLFLPHTSDIRSFILDQDIIYSIPK